MDKFTIHYCGEEKEVFVGVEGSLPTTAFTIGGAGGVLEVPYFGCVSSVTIDSSITYTIDSVNSKIILNIPRNRTGEERIFNFAVVWCIGDSTNAVITQEIGCGFYDDIVIAPESGGTLSVPYFGCITSAEGLPYSIDSVNKVVNFTVPTNYTFDDLSYTITAHWCDGTDSTLIISQPIIDINMCKCFVFNHDEYGTEISRYRIPCNGNNTLTYQDINNITLSNASVILKPCTTSVGDTAFSYESITSITFHENVVSIGASSFYNCSGLTELTLLEGLRSIGENAFVGCNSLSSITIPSTLETISRTSFNSDLSYVDYLYIRSNVYLSTMGLGQHNAKNVTLGGNIAEVPSYVFNALSSEYCERMICTYTHRCLSAACTNIGSLVLESSVTSIADRAFENCSGLTSVTLSNNLNTIGVAAFYNTTKLPSVVIPSSVQSIGEGAFNTNASYDPMMKLKEQFPTYISFDESTDFSAITFLGEYPPTLGDCLFRGTIHFKVFVPKASINNYLAVEALAPYVYSIEEPDILANRKLVALGTHYSNDVVQFCDGDDTPEPLPSNNFNKLVFGDCVTTTSGLGSSIRSSGCLKEVVFSKEVENIHDNVFYDCFFFSSVTFNEDSELKTIGNYSFWRCSNLKEFIVPSGVTSIGASAFQYTSALTRFEFAYGSRLRSIGASAFDSHTRATGYERSGIRSISIPSGVTTIGSSAFTDCIHLSSLTFDSGSSLSAINDYTFYGTNALSGELKIPASVENIGNSAFQVDSSYTLQHNLTRLTFESGSVLEMIGNDAFNGREGLAYVDLPDGLLSIGARAFRNCYIYELRCNATTPPTLGAYALHLSIDPIGYIYVPRQSVEAYKTANGWNTYADRIRAIGDEGVITLVDNSGNTYTYTNASYWRDFTRGENYNDTIVSVSIDRNVDYLYLKNFYALSSVTLPNNSGLATISSEAFKGCSGLTGITLPLSVTGIGYNAFENCSSLNSITIPSGVTTIYSSAFTNCTSLTSITFPNSLSTIENGVCRNCTALNSVIIPSSVTAIKRFAFSGCTGLTSIICLPETPPDLENEYVFYNTNNCPIYVPAQSVEAYKAASGWSYYSNRIQAIPNS